MVSGLQLQLYAVASFPILTMVAATLLLRDLLLMLLVDFLVVAGLSVAASRIVASNAREEDQHLFDSDWQRERGRQPDPVLADPKEKKHHIQWLGCLLVGAVSAGAYLLMWTAGLSYQEQLYTLMPRIDRGAVRWLYYVAFFFLFPTAYSAVESKFYYSDVLKNLEGNQVQAWIVGFLAASKAVVVIYVAFDAETGGLLWAIPVWYLLNFIMAYFAFGPTYMSGSVSRQLAYLCLLVGWVLLHQNPFQMNSRPKQLHMWHPKSVLG